VQSQGVSRRCSEEMCQNRGTWVRADKRHGRTGGIGMPRPHPGAPCRLTCSRECCGQRCHRRGPSRLVGVGGCLWRPCEPRGEPWGRGVPWRARKWGKGRGGPGRGEAPGGEKRKKKAPLTEEERREGGGKGQGAGREGAEEG